MSFFRDIFDWLTGNVPTSSKVSDFSSFSELMKTVVDFNGDITDPTKTKAALWFYNYWGTYLQPVPGFLSFLDLIGGWVVIVLYNFTSALENVFNNLFKLFGLFGYLGDSNTLIGTFYKGFQYLGLSIFILLAIVQIIISVFGKPFKYKDAILHAVIVTGVVAVLPMTVTKFSQVMYDDITGENGIENVGNTSKDSLALQPIKNNVVDLMVLVNGDFNTKEFSLDKYGNLTPKRDKDGKIEAYNYITDNPDKKGSANFVTHIDFGSALGATDTKTLDKLEKKGHKGIKGLFLHYPSDTRSSIQAVNEHRFISGANLAEKVYMRYKTNFFAIYAQYIVLIILLIMMSVKLVTSIFELIITGMVAPIQGYSSVTSHKKFKELILTMTGTIAGIYFEVIIMRVVLEIMRDFPTLTMASGNSTTSAFFEGLGTFESAITSIIVYLGLFFGAMQGVTIVERWLGVSVGHNSLAQQMMGAMMVTNAVSGVAGAAGHAAAGAAGAVMAGAKAAPNAISKAANKASKLGGMASGVSNNIGSQGLGATAKGGLNNMADKASGKMQGGLNSLKDSHNQGKATAENATKNNNPSSKDLMNHPNAYGPDAGGSPKGDGSSSEKSPGGNASGNDKATDGDSSKGTAGNQGNGGLNDTGGQGNDGSSDSGNSGSGDQGGLNGGSDIDGGSDPQNENGGSDPGNSGTDDGNGLSGGSDPSDSGTDDGNGLSGGSDPSDSGTDDGNGLSGGSDPGNSGTDDGNGLSGSSDGGSNGNVSYRSSSGNSSRGNAPVGKGNTNNGNGLNKKNPGKKQPTTEEKVDIINKNVAAMQKKMKPSQFDKAKASYQQAKGNFTQSAQQLTSGRSHIRGKTDDDE